mmetsp:Transcript_13230/g.28086  ORF Transcript_13230/g.28086 Transcript_13230/m.28086 type:complete len:276 (-) Transcript_13230:78-905(-)
MGAGFGQGNTTSLSGTLNNEGNGFVGRSSLGMEDGDHLHLPGMEDQHQQQLQGHDSPRHDNMQQPRPLMHAPMTPTLSSPVPAQASTTHFHPSPPQQHWTRRISSTTKCLISLLLLLSIVGAIMVADNVTIPWGGADATTWQWIDYLYFLSFVKVGVSIVKYIPQVALNYQRKSTSGWQIWNILLDFSGGTLSIVQLVGDSMAEANAQGLPHSWTGIVGNPAKLGLGMVSIFFDVIFMFQHYVLYRHSPSSRNNLQNERDAILNRDFETPLLSDR